VCERQIDRASDHLDHPPDDDGPNDDFDHRYPPSSGR
jgi:hypothetical protein